MRLLISLTLVLIASKMAASATLGCTTSTNIIFVLDSSGSVQESMHRTDNWGFLRSFIRMTVLNLARSMDRRGPYAASGLKFALVQFANTARTTFNFDRYRDHNEVADAVRNIQNIGGATNLAAGLREAERLLPTQSSFNSRNNIIVIISDFQANTDGNELFVAQRLKNRNDVKIVSVGIRGQVDQALMRQTASDNRVVLSDDYLDLVNHISPLLKVMCQSQGVIEPTSDCAKDVVLIMDASVTLTDWRSLKEFAALVAGNLGNTNRNTRIAVVIYSDFGRVISQLGSYSQSLANTIRNAAHNRGINVATNIADGLRQAQRLLTDSSRQRHVILFSDGIPTRESGAESSVAYSMRRAGINIIIYGVGNSVNQDTLQGLVENNQRNTHVIVNPTYSISQMNSVVSLAACPITPPPTPSQCAKDVVLIMDASVDLSVWNSLKQFAETVTVALANSDRNTRFGVVTYSDFGRVISQLVSYSQSMVYAIRNAAHNRGIQEIATNIADGLRQAQRLLTDSSRQRHVILFSDGIPTRESGTESSVAYSMRRAGINIIIYGVGDSVNQDTLRGLVENHQRNTHVLLNPTYSVSEANRVVSLAACPRTQTPPPPPPPPTPSQCAKDVVLIMDASVDLSVWNSLKQFAETVTVALANSDRNTRFGVVTYSDFGRVISQLVSYSQSMVYAIRNAAHNRGIQEIATNIADGLRQAQRLLTDSSRQRHVILFSDGIPTRESGTESSVAYSMRRAGINIIIYGVGETVNRDTLQTLVEDYQRNTHVFVDSTYSVTQMNSVVSLAACLNAPPPPPPSQCTRDIVLVMDSSVILSVWNSLKQFAEMLAAALSNSDRNTRIGVVIYSDFGRVISQIGSNSQSVANTIRNAAHNRGIQEIATNIADGLRQAQRLLTDRSRQRHVILFSDGVPSRERGAESSVAYSMRRAGINIIVYGVGDYVNTDTLRGLVEDSQRNSHVISNPTYSVSQMNSIISLAACPRGSPAAPCVQQQADVVLAIDASGSILDKGANNWQLMQDFAVGLVRQLVSRYPQVRIGALTFSASARKIMDITSNNQQVILAIRNAQNQRSTTNQYDALSTSRDILNAAPRAASGTRSKTVIMITDGEHNVGSTARVKTIADELERAGIKRIVVGVTRDVNHRNLEDITSRSNMIFYSQTFDTLNSVPLVTNVVQATSYCPSETVRDLPTTCMAVDIIFAMDRSGSIETTRAGNFGRLKNFVSDLARSMDRRYSQVRFGLVAFSDTANIIAWLKRYNNVEDFVNVIQRVSYLGSHTNMAAAIRESRRALGQDGTKSPQIVLVTDGEATIEVGQEYTEASTARSFGIRLSAIAVTQKNFESALMRITSSRDRVFRAPDFQQVQNVVTSVTRVACQQPGGSSVACTGLPEIVFILDVSASITDNEVRSAKDFIINAIETFSRGNTNSRFALVTFSSSARTVFDLTSDKNLIRRMMDGVNIDSRGSTNIAAGLERGQQILQPIRSGRRGIVILITDGWANDRVGEELTIANTMKSDRISIVPIGITESGPHYNKLQQMASTSNGVIRSLNFAMLNTKVQALTNLACSLTNTPYYPNPVLTTPSPRTPNPPQPALPIRCPGSHVVFVIDASRRLNPTQADLDLTNNLAVSLMRQIAASKPNTKFGVISYDASSEVDAGFPPYRSVNEIANAISSIVVLNDQDSGYSHISYGLFEARNLITQAVDTQSVMSYIILFSDGFSNRGEGVEFVEARMARSMGIRILAIGFGDVNIGALTRLTGDSSVVYRATRGQLPSSTIANYISSCGATAPSNVYYSRQDNHCPEEIVFVVDSAGNDTMDEWNKRNVSNFMSSMVEEYARFYDVRGRFAAIQLSGVAEVSMRFSKDLPYVTYTLSHLQNMNDSDECASVMAEGLRLANGLFSDDKKLVVKKERLVILITDEVADNETTANILDEVQKLKDKEIHFIVAGIAKEPESDVFFEKIAGSSGAISVTKHNKLTHQVNTVINTACKTDVMFHQNDPNDQINLDQ